MANDPEPDPDPGETNPFKGTPFEQFFAAGGPLSGMAGLGGASGMDLNQIISQFKAMMEPHEGPLNWKVVDDLARSVVAQQPDPSPGSAADFAARSRFTPADRNRSQREFSDMPARRSRSPGRSSGSTARTRTVEPSVSATSTGCTAVATATP